MTDWASKRWALCLLMTGAIAAACGGPGAGPGSGSEFLRDGEGGAGGDDADGDEADDGDEGAGGEGAGDACDCSGEADLPYNVDLPLGATFKLSDAFAMKGPQPAAVLSLAMSAPPEWRLAELLADTPYVVDQADCDHEGNHGQGRDRYEITWQNADGSTESDHFTIRYCEVDELEPPDGDDGGDCDCGGGEGGGGATTSASAGATTGSGVPGCDVPCSAATPCDAGSVCVDGCCVIVPE